MEDIDKQIKETEAWLARKKQEVKDAEQKISLLLDKKVEGKLCTECAFNSILDFNWDDHTGCLQSECVLCRGGRACEKFMESNPLSQLIAKLFDSDSDAVSDFNNKHKGVSLNLAEMIEDIENMNFYIILLNDLFKSEG
jgi:hypothetical protein